MQSNVITLNVDELNNDTTVSTPYTRFDEYQNRTVYVGENHTLASRDQLTLYRSFPSPSGNFKGVGKSSFKLSRDFIVDGADGVSQLVSPMIIEVKVSIPIGVSDADVLKMRQTAVAMLDLDTVMDELNQKLMI